MCASMCACISSWGDDKKPGEIPQTGASPRTQSYPEDGSLSFAKPEGSGATAGKEQQEGSQPTMNFSAKLLWVFGVQS